MWSREGHLQQLSLRWYDRRAPDQYRLQLQDSFSTSALTTFFCRCLAIISQSLFDLALSEDNEMYIVYHKFIHAQTNSNL